MKTVQLFGIAACLVMSFAAANAQTRRITFKAPLLYPEGVALSADGNTFFVSSVKTGTIGTVDGQGNYQEFYKDKNLVSSFGMKIEPARNRLWICLSDPNPNYSEFSTPATFQRMARLIAVDINTRKKVADINLEKLHAGKHFINDLTFDDKGNIYLTDSFSPVIYKVDAAGKPSVFAENPLFKSIDIGLNGIVYHPSGFLLTVNNSDGSILRVNINDPKQVVRVKIPNLFPGADGLMIDQGDKLILIQNKSIDKCYRIESADNWQTASVTASTQSEDRFQQPSTGVVQNGKIWLLNSKLNELSNPTIPPSREFSLQLAELKPLN